MNPAGRLVLPLRPWLSLALAWPVLGADAPMLTLHARHRETATNGTSEVRVTEDILHWSPAATAVVVCDLWDRHWCRGATERVAALAPRVDAFLETARDRGALIIHCPSGTMGFYEGTPQRKLAQAAPASPPRAPVLNWCGRDPEREPPLPIDDADGGCDDEPPCQVSQPWTRQIERIRIAPGDAVSDSGEVLNLLAARGITNVMVLGVHLNMCVLGRPFGIRQLVRQGKNVVLVRDLTDTMYNSRQRPQVNHFTGTDLMVAHVEEHWCPSIVSVDLLGGAPFRFAADDRPRVVAILGEDEYETGRTVPEWAGSDLAPAGAAVTVLHEAGDDPGYFPGLERELTEADVLFVSVRRRGLPPAQMAAIRRHLAAGGAVIGIRTASHAFAPRGQELERGEGGERATWIEFDPEVLGGHYDGHHGEGPITTLRVAEGMAGSPILEGVTLEGFVGHGSLYRTSPLAEGTQLLLWGSIPGRPAEPVAWTRRYGPDGAKVFYTSLGHPDDFAEVGFRRLLRNAVAWAAAE